jgi:hypothetical protein
MPRSRLFSLQARRASVQVATLAQSLSARQDEARQSRAMEARLAELLDSLGASHGQGQGAISVAHLRDMGHLATRLGAEQERQSAAAERAEAKSETLRMAMQAQLRQQRSAEEAATHARRAEALEQAQKHDAARPPWRKPS